MSALVSTFIGEERRTIEVVSLASLHETRRRLPVGDGWGMWLRATEAELRNLGAYQIDGGEWLLDCGADGYLGCEVQSDVEVQS